MILNKKRFAKYESCHKVSLFSIIKHHKVFIETMYVLHLSKKELHLTMQGIDSSRTDHTMGPLVVAKSS